MFWLVDNKGVGLTNTPLQSTVYHLLAKFDLDQMYDENKDDRNKLINKCS